MKNKWVWIIIVIIMLLLLFVFFVSGRNKSNRTTTTTPPSIPTQSAKNNSSCEIVYETNQAKWKEYTNDTLKLSFRYPESFTVGIVNVADIKIIGNAKKGCGSAMFITYMDNVAAPKCEAEFTRVANESKLTKVPITNQKISDVAGQQSCEYTSEAKDGSQINYRKTIETYKGGRDYTFKISTYNKSDIDIFDGIVNTLSFTIPSTEKWSGTWTNSLGESGKDTLEITNDGSGNLKGLWSGNINVTGQMVDKTTLKFTGRTEVRSYEVNGIVNGDTLTLNYVATRLNSAGSYTGEEKLSRILP